MYRPIYLQYIVDDNSVFDGFGTKWNIPCFYYWPKSMYYSKELYELIKIHKPRSPKYYIDELAKTYGHEIMRLPPYHCDLNPTELIWSQIKNYVATNNKDFNIKSIQMLFDKALHKVTDIDWKNAIRHVVDIEQSYWQKDHIVDIEIEQILIKLAEDSDDSTDSGTDSED